MDPEAIRTSFLEQASKPDNINAYPGMDALRRTSLDRSADPKFTGDALIRQYREHVGALYQNRLGDLGMPADPQGQRQLEDSVHDAVRTHALDTLAGRMEEEGQTSRFSVGYLAPRVPFLRHAGAAADLLKERDAQEAFQSRTADGRDFLHEAGKLAESRRQAKTSNLGKAVDAVSTLPAVAAEWAPGAAAGAGEAVAGNVANRMARAGMEATLGQAPRWGTEAALATAQRAQRGEPWDKAAGQEISKGVISSGVFGAVDPLGAGFGSNYIAKVANKVALLGAASETEAGAQKALGLSEQAGPLAELWAAKTKEDRQKAATNLLVNFGAVGLMEAGLHIHEARQGGHDVDMDKAVDEGAQAVLDAAKEKPDANAGTPPGPADRQEAGPAQAQAPGNAAPAEPGPQAPEGQEPRPTSAPGAPEDRGEGHADQPDGAAAAGAESGPPGQPDAAGAPGLPASAERVLDAGRVDELRKMLAAVGEKSGRLSDARVIERARELKLDRFEEPGKPTSTGTIRQPTALEKMQGETEEPKFGQPVTAAEQRTLPGGGQEDAAGAERPLKVTALANAKVDEERQARNEPPLMKTARLANAEVWDRAMARIEQDPEAGAKLVDALEKEPRSPSVEENALLLHRKIALANETTKAQLAYIDAFKNQASALDRKELEARAQTLDKQMDRLDRVLRTTGTEAGRAFQFRRQLAAEDYSLQGMLRKAAVANGGEPVAPAEQAKVADLTKRLADLQAKLDAALKAAQGKPAESPEFADVEGTVAATEKVKDEFKALTDKLDEKQKGFGQKVADLLLRIRRMEVISGPLTAVKIPMAAAYRLASTPVKEALGTVLRQVPGVDKIAGMAPREGAGFESATERKAARAFFVDGMKDAWDNVRMKKSTLDLAYGKDHPDVPYKGLDWFGWLHAAMKAPAKRAEFTRSFLKNRDFAAAHGVDVTDPAQLLLLGSAAYADAERAIFMQDNRLVGAYNAGIRHLEAGGALPRAGAFAAKMALPIVRVPTNFVAETVGNVTGLVTGSAQAALAYRRGIETLKPAEADLIMRRLKNGSAGTLGVTLGFLAPAAFGGIAGYFQTGEKRRTDDVPVGKLRTPYGDVPKYALHDPAIQAAMYGASIRRSWDASKHKDGETLGFAEALGDASLGLVHDNPFVHEATDVAEAMDFRQRGRFFGELTKSLAVPQLVQWLASAADTDPSGATIKRSPQSVAEHIETGIPGLRQRVPVSTGTRRRLPLAPSSVTTGR